MNNKDDIIENFVDEINKIDFGQISAFDGVTCTIDLSEHLILIDKIKSLFNSLEELPGNKFSFRLIDSIRPGVLFFYDEKDFINRSKLDLEKFKIKSVVFLNPKGISDIKLITGKETEKFAINFLTYKAIRDLFKRTKEIAQFKNDSSKTLTLLSKEYGLFNIGYILPHFSYFYTISIEGKAAQLEKEFEKKEFVQFFKEIIVTSVHSADEKDRLKVIINQLDSIIDLTNKDYEAYVSNFAIDKIKSDFKKERESYFESIDRSISSIEKQVVGFPLTFAASIFASYKVQDKPGVLLLVLLAYLLYTLIAYIILSITAYNVKCLAEDVESEKNTIKNSYGKIYSDFETDFKKIKVKITLLCIAIIALYLILTFLLILFASYVAHNMQLIDLSNWVSWLPETE